MAGAQVDAMHLYYNMTSLLWKGVPGEGGGRHPTLGTVQCRVPHITRSGVRRNDSAASV
jgi:hypothetical protein